MRHRLFPGVVAWVSIVTLTIPAGASGAQGTTARSAPPIVPWNGVLEARIGGPGEDAGLTAIGSVTVDPVNGMLYVGQRQDNLIRRYTRAGEQAGAIGRAGDGPGEFRRLGRLGWIGDTLVAMDGGRRAHLFDRGGTLLRTLTLLPLAVPAGEPSATPFMVLARGILLGSSSISAREIAADRHVHYRADTAARTAEIVARTEVPRGVFSIRGTLMFNERIEELLARSAIVAPSPAGTSFVVVRRDLPPDRQGLAPVDVVRLAASGDTLWRTELRLPTARVPGALTDSIVNALAEGLVKRGEATVTDVRTALRFPSHFPAVTSVVHGADGTVWLKTRAASMAGTEWIVLDDAGRLFASITTPGAARLLHADRRGYWLGETDADGVPFLSRYRIR